MRVGDQAPKTSGPARVEPSPAPPTEPSPAAFAPAAPLTPPAAPGRAAAHRNTTAGAIVAQKFSRPPSELADLLTAEIDRAFTFAKNLNRAITFFGGARIKPEDAAFAEGKTWGEAVLLANAEAFAPGAIERAASLGAFSPEALQAAKGAMLGLAVGALGPSAVAAALSLGGGASGLAAGLAQAAGRRGDPGDRRFLSALTRTGAGPGMMEAVPIGYLDGRQKIAELVPELADKTKTLITQGSRIQLPFEQETSPYVETLEQFAHFLPRRLALTEQSDAFVVFPGGFGTLNELFEVWRMDRPVLLHSQAFFGPMKDALEAGWRSRGLETDERIRQVFAADGVDEGLPRLVLAMQTASEPTPPSGERAAAMVSELTRGLDRLTRLEGAVTIVGGERLPADAKELDVAEALARRLGERGGAVRVGTEGAVLARVAKGARAGKAELQGMFIDEGGLPKGIQSFTDATEVVQSSAAHKILLYENSHAFVALPGGVRTLDEVFEVACLMQCQKIPERPLVLVGREFWQPILDAIEQAMLNGQRQTIGPTDMKLFTVVDTLAEAEAAIGRAG